MRFITECIPYKENFGQLGTNQYDTRSTALIGHTDPSFETTEGAATRAERVLGIVNNYIQDHDQRGSANNNNIRHLRPRLQIWKLENG